MNNQKKLVGAFKNFVEKVFLPGLKRTDPQLSEWNRFSQQLNNQYINYDVLAQYVEQVNAKPAPQSFANTFEKRELPPFKKRNEEATHSNGESGGFNPSKTFGGERARAMFSKPEMDDFGEKGNNGFGVGGKGEERGNRQFQTSPQMILPGLEKMCKMFVENNQRFEALLGGSSGTPPSKYT